MERGIKILYWDIHMAIPEIAAKMSMTEQQVEKIVEKFGKTEEKWKFLFSMYIRGLREILKSPCYFNVTMIVLLHIWIDYSIYP